jgi:peptidoglycan/LPS O-acetylase OafA/YrhL
MPSSTSRAAGSYRPDIDGLRAVAVLLVVFSHLLKTHLRGGYVGVDVFFVISGYLIGAGILADLRAGSFSLFDFYERRVRRIFPALFVMLLGTSLLAYVLLLPTETLGFARSLLATLFSVSNIWFWKESGYFDAGGASKPLRHTWSLGVEEQFYVFFPLFLLAIHRWCPRALKTILWGSVFVSLCAASCFIFRFGETTAFYWAPLRAWELLLGTIASQGYLPRGKTPLQREAISVAGLLLILLPGVFYSSYTRFPGLAALPPVLGAVLLMQAGETGSFVSSALSWRPVVFIGLISYSLYLWHWPLKVFLESSFLLRSVNHGETIGKLFVFAGSLLLAILSWRFIETPFRRGLRRPNRKWLSVYGLAGSAAIVAAGMGMITTRGWSGRFREDVLRMDQYSAPAFRPEWREGQCFLSVPSSAAGLDSFANFDQATCLRADDSRGNYLLYGDSHAAAAYPGLVKVFPELNWMQANVSSCAPLLKQSGGASVDCKKMSEFMYGTFLPHHRVDAVVLSANWTEALLPELERSLAWMKQHGLQTIVTGPGIQFNDALPRLLALSLRNGKPTQFLGRERDKEKEQLDRRMADLARTRWHVRYISVYADLCGRQTESTTRSRVGSADGCPVYAPDGSPLLFDSNHLSAGGSEMLAKAIQMRNELP